MDLKELEIFGRDLIKVIDKKKPHNSGAMISFLKIAEELGETAQIIVKLEGVERKRKYLPNENLIEDLGSEIADILIVLSALAARYNIDLDKVLSAKIELEKERWKNE